MSSGLNKEPYKRLENNILPSFEDEGWQEQGTVDEVSRMGSEIGFKSKSGSGYSFYVDNPESYIGKRVSLSVEVIEGIKPVVTLWIMSNGVVKTHLVPTYINKLEDILIPNNTTSIRVKLENNQDGVHYAYFKNVQLEVGERATLFGDRKLVSKPPLRGIRFKGLNGYLKTSRILEDVTSNGRYTLEAIIKVKSDTKGTILQNSTNGSVSRCGLGVDGNGNVSISHYDGTKWSGASVKLPNSGSAHIIGTNDGGVLRIFVNGVEGFGKGAHYVSTGKDGAYVGRVDIDDRSFFKGELELIRVYSRALSGREILSVFENAIINDSVSLELDFSSVNNESGMVKDLSGNGNDATIYGDAVPIQRAIRKKPKTSLKNQAFKKSFKKYPFLFERKSVNRYNEKIVGLNQPRIDINGGLLIEDGSSNSIVNHGESDTIPYSRDTSGVTISRTDEVEPLFGNVAYKWSKVPKTGTGNIYLNSSGDLDGKYSREWTFSCYVKRSDGLPVTDVGIAYMYANNSSGTRINKNKSPSYIEECGDGWYRVVRQDYTSENSYISLVGLSSLDATIDWYFDGWQLENKPYPTSFTTEVRDSEIAKIENVEQYLDSLRGSIELNVVPTGGFNVKSVGYGYQDLTCYNNGGFIIRRNRLNVGEIEFVVNAIGAGTSYESTNLDLENGKPIKYRIDWDANENATSLTVNDSKKIVHPMLRMPKGDLNIGHRGDILSHNRGNAIYGNITIRDRWGRVVYKM